MSAYVVSKSHIDAMVQAGINMPPTAHTGERFLRFFTGKDWMPITLENANAIGQLLVDTCVQGVNHRYPDDDPAKGELPGPTDAYYTRPYKFQPTRGFTPGEIVSMLSNYDYQASEHRDWEKTPGFYYCDALRSRLLKFLSELHEAKHGELPWGFDEADVREATPTRPAVPRPTIDVDAIAVLLSGMVTADEAGRIRNNPS